MYWTIATLFIHPLPRELSMLTDGFARATMNVPYEAASKA
jgi:hypothetical protein